MGHSYEVCSIFEKNGMGDQLLYNSIAFLIAR